MIILLAFLLTSILEWLVSYNRLFCRKIGK
jgi:hypothetical protein